MKICRIHQNGGPETLKWEEVASPQPQKGEVLLKVLAAGVNYIDTYHRSGLYPLELPSPIGIEGVAEVIGCGEGVQKLKLGQRVVSAMSPMGFYAEALVAAETELVPVPDGICSQKLAATWLKGLTCAYLLHDTFPVQKGQTILVHAAAGGVGHLMVQWAKRLGAKVIGTVGTPEKAMKAKAWGCDEVIQYQNENIVERVMDITAGQGVPVVYDSVGASTFQASLKCCATRGTLVSYGNASGPVPPFSALDLTQHGSLFITRPTLAHYYRTTKEKQRLDQLVFDILPQLDVSVSTYPMLEAEKAHRDLEARKTQGSIVLLPESS